MANLRLENVTKIYEKNVVGVKGISIDVPHGSFLVVVGPSGCGKSTLLRLIAGLEKLTTGKIFIDGVLVNDLSPKERNIAMVFQDYALYPHMTVRENMGFGLRMRGVEGKEIERRVLLAAKILQIEHLLDRKPGALSGGQRQRVALGRAIVREPSLFLFDEPLSNLDAKLREEMRLELLRLHDRLNATVVYVTHDQIEAMTMGTSIAVLNKGELQQLADPLTLYNKPENLFVAGFIGSPTMNFVNGELLDGRFVSADLELDLPGDFATFRGKVTLGMRPEDIVPGEGNFEGVIEVMETLGSEVYLYLRLVQSTLVVRTKPNANFKKGTKIKFNINMGKIHLFDSATGKRIN